MENIMENLNTEKVVKYVLLTVLVITLSLLIKESFVNPQDFTL